MMIHYKHLKVPEVTSYSKKSKRYYDDNIFCFDIETTSMFNFDGEWKPFIYDDSIDYTDIPKAAVPYIWMFSVNNAVYYGREFEDFEKVLQQISNPLYCRVVWTHNLSFEFGYLPQILNKYTITEMVAREKRKPIQFYVKELNILFKCSYMLTNMSLDNAAKEFTKISKKTGQLDYNVLRSPLTELSELEKEYCEYDCLVLKAIIEVFRDRYNGIAKIPLTSTSTVRAAIKNEVDYGYIKHQQNLVPNPEMYLRYWWSFAGGYTHANVLNASKIFRAKKVKGKYDESTYIHSKDIASSYPTVMLTEKFPCQAFRRCKVEEFFNPDKREKYAYLLKVRLYVVESKYYNHYLQYEKVKVNVVNPVTDNGRIVKCDFCEYWLTDIDYDIMTTNYHVDKIEIVEIYKSLKRYLDIRILKFIIDLYQKKTALKGFTSDDPNEVEQVEAIYRASKALLNGIFGMSVTSILHTACYENHEWCIPEKLDYEKNPGKSYSEMFSEFVEEKLADAKRSFSTLFYYPVGVWITSYARRNLVMRLFTDCSHIEGPSDNFDRDSIYMDTDSIKYTGDYEWIFEEYNNELYKKYEKVVAEFPDELTIDMFMPEDRKGVKHPIGYFEDDGEYIEFITHGAKKYCYRSAEDGELHITVSGVSKKGVSALNDDIRNFRKDFKWGYSDSGKLMHTYIEDQDNITFTDVQGNVYTSHQKYSVVLQPTSYTLGITDFYEMLVRLFELGKMRRYEP